MEFFGILYKIVLISVGTFLIYLSTQEKDDMQQAILLRSLGSIMLLMLLVSMLRTVLK